MKVSVCLITYNHGDFLAEAIESVLSQKTDYEIEVVVGEDCSADSTREVLINYQRKYPHLIKPILQRRNVGIHQNLADVLKHASGEYIALLEGDDFWTSDEKLQRQSDLLDAHPELSMCFHRGVSFDVNDPASDFELPNVPEQPSYTLSDLLTKKNFMFTHSTMRRGQHFRTLPRLSWMADAIDYTLHILSAVHGDIGYIPEDMCRHRRHAGSYWFGAAMKSLLNVQMRAARDFETIDRYFRRRHATELRVSAYYFELAKSAFEAGNLVATQTCLRGVLRSMRYDPQLDREAVFDLMQRAEMPSSSLRAHIDILQARLPLALTRYPALIRGK